MLPLWLSVKVFVSVTHSVRAGAETEKLVAVPAAGQETTLFACFHPSVAATLTASWMFTITTFVSVDPSPRVMVRVLLQFQMPWLSHQFAPFFCAAPAVTVAQLPASQPSSHQSSSAIRPTTVPERLTEAYPPVEAGVPFAMVKVWPTAVPSTVDDGAVTVKVVPVPALGQTMSP